MMKSAIVTGASGFIGRYLVRELADNGYSVYAILRRPGDENLFNAQTVKSIICDLNDAGRLERLLAAEDKTFDYLFHLAWAGSAGNTRADYALQLGNARTACDMLLAADRLGCKRYIGAGSIMEDECAAYVPINGVAPSPNYVYSCAKMTAHYMCKAVASTLGTEFCWGKITNAYGAGDTTGRFLHKLIDNLMRGIPCDLTDGVQNYDFVYVSDAAKALRQIAEGGAGNASYLIGSGKAKPLREYVETVRKIVNPGGVIHYGAVPFSGVSLPLDCFSIHTLSQDTGYTPNVSFEEGIRITKKWMEEL